MRRLVLVVTGILLIGVTAGAQQPTDEFLVVPSVRVGPIRIRTFLDDVTAILGPYTEKRQRESQRIDYWWKRSDGWLGVRARQDSPLVVAVMVQYDERYGLEGGQVHIGVQETTVTAVMGPPTDVFRLPHSHFLVYQGVGFFVADASFPPSERKWVGKVYEIDVAEGFKP